MVEVDGGDLPKPLVEGYRANGGDLVDPVEWESRFGVGPIPSVSGDGVVLVEAVRRFDRRESGWVRDDESSWLVMSNGDRDALIAELVDAAGVSGTPQRTSSTDKGADCVVDTYPTLDGVDWQIQGCSYTQFPGLFALGVSRTAATADEPTVVDVTVGVVAESLAGEIVFSEVRLGEPQPDGSTLHLSTQLSTDVADADVAVASTSEVLVGWEKLGGEQSALFSGPTGSTWTISNGVAVFDWAGRW